MYDWVRENGRLLRQPIGDNIVNSLSTAPLFETDRYPARLIKRAHSIGNLRMGFWTFYDEPRPTTALRKARHALRLLGMMLRHDALHLPAYLRQALRPERLVPGWRKWLVQRRPEALQRARRRARRRAAVA
jgi:hypothetical protein